MPVMINTLLGQYVEEVKKIYGEQLRSVILYGSYARGDFGPDSDIDIMILVDLADKEIEKYGKQLSWVTYDFNEEHDTDIKPMAKNDLHFKKWLGVYPFYTNVQKEGWSCMEQPEKGSINDLVHYRIEIFPKTFGRRIARAEEIRHASDYDDFYIATKEKAEEQIMTAKELIEQIEIYCLDRLNG